MAEDEVWFKRRSYAHFDKPLTRDQANSLVTDPKKVAKHGFWPVILNPKKTLSLKDNDGKRMWSEKIRPITYAAHSDSHIYTYYARKLSGLLEIEYQETGGEHVLAYRKFDPPKCNIDFAIEVFDEIKDLGECDVIAIDVKGFFDSLDHVHLKRSWQKLLGVNSLSEDHYAIFKSCTRDRAISLPKLRDIFSGEVRRRTGKNGATICSPSTFREKVKPHLSLRHELVWEIKRKTPPEDPTGIPQGLPISAVLANIYMLEPDKKIKQKILDLGGSYRRYSDDILVVVPKGKGHASETAVIKELKDCGLDVQTDKTIRIRFEKNENELSPYSLDKYFSKLHKESISYLGLTFDGVNIRIRDSTISRFMIKAMRTIARAKTAAEKNESPKLNKRQLYARLTSLGYGSAYGKGVYDDAVILPKGAPRLGFHKYLNLAIKKTNSESIRRQQRQIENKIFREINSAEKSLLESIRN